MTDDDRAWMEWATRRHGWIYRRGFGPNPARRGRRLFQRAAALLTHMDRVAWRLGLVTRAR